MCGVRLMRHFAIPVLLVAGSLAARAQILSVTHEQPIAAVPATPHVTSDVAIDPLRPLRVIAAAERRALNVGMTQLLSTDGGVTWARRSLPLATGDAFHAGPAVAWTSDGAAWSLVRAGTATGTAVRLKLYRSLDDGATWSLHSTLSPQTAVGFHAFTADGSASSPFRDTLYAVWNNGRPAFVNRLPPGGVPGAPVQVSGAETTGTAFGAEVATDAQGGVYALWPDTGSRRIYLARSTNGGVSFTAPMPIATTIDSFDIGIPANAFRRVLIYVTAGTYRQHGRAMVYAAWNDLSAPGCLEPGGNPGAQCTTRIWLASSADGGATWSTPVKINDLPTLNDQFHPRLAVDPTNGVVSITYYDTVEDPGRRRVHLYVQSSADHGLTWSPPLRVTSASTDGAFTDFGDGNGLSGHGCRLVGTWIDRRSGGAEEVWAARLTHSPCRLYFEDFERSTGLSDWTRGAFSGSDSDWRGVQACAAHSGDRIFRMGGASCSANYGNDRFAFAQPAGATGIAVPSGAAGSRLSFWHRWQIQSDFDGATLMLSLNGLDHQPVPDTAIVSGSPYSGTIAAGCPPDGAAGLGAFSGLQSDFVQTVVDLDRACDAATGGTSGCAGRTLRIAFTEVADCDGVTFDGWFLDDVEVTTVLP